MHLEWFPWQRRLRKEEKRVDAAPRANFGTFDSMTADEKKPANRFMMIGVVAVLVIAAASTFAFLKMQKPKTSASAADTRSSECSSGQDLPPSGNAQPVFIRCWRYGPGASRFQHNCDASRLQSLQWRNRRRKRLPRNLACRKAGNTEKTTSVATLGSTGTSRIAKQNIAQPTPDVAAVFHRGYRELVYSFIQPGAACSILSARQQLRLSNRSLSRSR